MCGTPVQVPVGAEILKGVSLMLGSNYLAFVSRTLETNLVSVLSFWLESFFFIVFKTVLHFEKYCMFRNVF